MRDFMNAALPPPKPFRLEYPYGPPGDAFRGMAKPEKATCVAYYRGVDPELLRRIPQGNALRKSTEEMAELVQNMRDHGFKGGDGQRILIYVEQDGRPRIGEGNHRAVAAIEAKVPVEVEIRYLGNSDLEHQVWPFDHLDPEIRVISD